jgi:hypothetical protein
MHQRGQSDKKAGLSHAISWRTLLRRRPLHRELEDWRATAREQYRDAKLAIVDEARTADGRPEPDAAAWSLANGFPVDYGRAAAKACQAPPAPFFPDAERLLERCEPAFRSVGVLIAENEALTVGVERCRTVSAAHQDAGCAAVENVTIPPETRPAVRKHDESSRNSAAGRRSKNVTIRPETQPTLEKHDKPSRKSAAGRLTKNVTIRPETQPALEKHDKPSRNSAAARLSKNVTIRPETQPAVGKRDEPSRNSAAGRLT